MIETLESRRMLTSLPVTHVPVDMAPTTIRIVTLEEFLQMETWNDDEIVVEWYSTPSESSDEDWDEDWLDDDLDADWQYELEEEEGEMWDDDEDWLEDVCEDGPTDYDESLDDEDWAFLEDSDVLEAPIAFNAGAEASSSLSFSDGGSITDKVLGADDEELLG
jgi:hypothetical protein